MKFNIYSWDLKSAVERLSPIAGGKSLVPVFDQLRIEASEGRGTVKFSACSSVYPRGFKRCEVAVPAQTAQGGVCYIKYADIKKVFTIPDDVTVTTNEQTILFSNGRKKMRLPMPQTTDEELPVFEPKGEQKSVMQIHESDLLETIQKLAPFLATGDNRPVHTGYHFNAAQHRIEAVDGYHLGIRFCDGCASFNAETCNAVVPGNIQKDFSKLLDKKRNKQVSVEADDKYIYFYGPDFLYQTTAVEGEFLDIDKSIPQYGYDNIAFALDDPAELMGIMKEYTKFAKIGKKLLAPAILVLNGTSLSTYLQTSELETSDTVESFSPYQGRNNYSLTTGVNPIYMVDALSVFDNRDPVEVQMNTAINPIVFENAEYLTMVLPVRIKPDVQDTAEKFVA